MNTNFDTIRCRVIPRGIYAYKVNRLALKGSVFDISTAYSLMSIVICYNFSCRVIRVRIYSVHALELHSLILTHAHKTTSNAQQLEFRFSRILLRRLYWTRLVKVRLGYVRLVTRMRRRSYVCTDARQATCILYGM